MKGNRLTYIRVTLKNDSQSEKELVLCCKVRDAVKRNFLYKSIRLIVVIRSVV